MKGNNLRPFNIDTAFMCTHGVFAYRSAMISEGMEFKQIYHQDSEDDKDSQLDGHLVKAEDCL